MTLAAIIIGYILLLLAAGAFGFFLGITPAPDYEKHDLTKRGEHPQVQLNANKSFPYDHLRIIGVSEIKPYVPAQEDRESLPPTRPEGMRL
jgi:hypothetical protein